MKILGISAYYHDSAAALVEDGKILAAAQEERFTRKKHDASFPEHAIQFCLKSNFLKLSDIDAIVFYDKPFLKFERLLETYYSTAPKGLFSFIKSMPIWLKEKLFLKKTIKDALKEIDETFSPKKIYFSEHHLSHAASAFFPSSFHEAATLTIDGVGEWATATIGIGRENSIEILKEMHFPDSVGLLYSAFTFFLGFKVNSGEYKLMGLAPYGNPNSERTNKYIEIIKKNIVQIHDDGSILLNQSFFKYQWGLKMIQTKKWEQLFGFKIRKAESDIQKHHCDLAFAIQHVTEDIVLKMAKHAKEITNCSCLCLSGGVALNCVSNGKIIKKELFEDLYIQPASGDAGGAVGAALAYYYMGLNNERLSKNNTMQNAYLGPDYSELVIKRDLERIGCSYSHFDSQKEIVDAVISKIEKGAAVGVFRGKMEFGPRALGNRSIIADARNPEAQTKLNLKIKKRESFRPFAPILLEEEVKELFQNGQPSPYMLLVDWLKESERNLLPEGYHENNINEMLQFTRSKIPSVTHIDYSARLQTVTKSSNRFIHSLLLRFKEKHGIGLLINTSFNLRGEPIVCSPEDAIRCFLSSEMDVLLLENFILYREEQPKDLFSLYNQTFQKD